MKFGKHLEENKVPEWADYYIDYNKLKKILKQVEVKLQTTPKWDRPVSLSTAPPTNAAAMPETPAVTENDFFSQLDADMEKVQKFTRTQVMKDHHPVARNSPLILLHSHSCDPSTGG